jgi:hypothetical protein
LKVSDFFQICRDNPHSGNECVELSTPKAKKTRKGKGALYNFPHSRIASTECHGFKKGEKIKISLWARSKPAGQKFFITFQWYKKSVTFTATDKWKKYTFELTAPCNVPSSKGCMIVHKESDLDKKLYIDDAAIEVERVNMDKSLVKKSIPPEKILATLEAPEAFSEKFLFAGEFYNSQTGAIIENSAKTYAFATPEKLFVKFVMPTSGDVRVPDKIAKTDNESKIFKNDIGEIFLMSENGVYYHFVFDAAGNKFDQKIIGERSESDWNGIWNVEPKITDGGWEAIVEIPHSTYSLSKKPPEVIMGNFNRETPGCVPSCWAPTFGRFHTPSRFGKLKFDNHALLARKFIGVTSMTMVKNPVSNSKDLTVKLIGNIPDNSIFSLLTKDRVFKSKIEKNQRGFSVALSLPSGLTEKEIISYKVSSPKNEIVFESKDKDIIQEQELFNAYLNKSYYSYEKKARLNCDISLDRDEILKRDFTLHWELINAGMKGEAKCKNENVRASINLEKLPLGDNKLLVLLYDGSGKLCYKQTLNLIKAGNNIRARSKIDRERLCLEIDGKPLIIKGITLPTIRVSNFKKGFKEHWRGYVDGICDFIDKLPEYGFNMVRLAVWCEDDPDLQPTLHKILKSLKENNIYIFIRFKPSKALKKKYSYKEFSSLIYKNLDTVKDNEQIMAFLTVDEPGLWWFKEMDYKPPYKEEGLQELYDTFRKKVKYRPVYLNYAQTTLRKMYGGKGATDIYSFDRYVFGRRGHEVFTGDLWLEDARFLGAASRKDRKPFGNWIQCTAGYEWATFPNQRQMLYQGYFSIINGARIIYNFVFHLAPESKDTLRGISKFWKECSILEPAILNGKTVHSACSDKRVLTLTLQYNKKLYLITLNSSRDKVSANIKLPIEKFKDSKAKVMFENRTLDLNGGAVNDIYLPLERHVYSVEIE